MSMVQCHVEWISSLICRGSKRLNPARIERTTLRISQLESHALPLCQGFMFIRINACYINFMLCRLVK